MQRNVHQSLLLVTTLLFSLLIGMTLAMHADEPRPATVCIVNHAKAISPDLFGIFFEDINYAADGGLYAELVQNRSFEYSRADNQAWNSLTAWELLQRGEAEASVTVDSATSLNANNPHYALLIVEQVGNGAGLANDGFDGIPIKKDETYDVSLFAKVIAGQPGPIHIRLEGAGGNLLGETEVAGLSNDWMKHTASITARDTDTSAKFVLLLSGTGTVALDMVSLFPQKTFHDRPNGLRADLAQVIADLQPKFIRFPGGCLAHGDGLENMYRWKDTIGPVEQRKAQRNIWRYHQTMGLGYYEYFQFCEDIGAKPLPVVPAGVCCQNSGHYLDLVPRGQQGLPLEEMPDYVQEVLDLIEWANGPATSTWGAKRAAAGHPEPFHLEYLGVGNEDEITPAFKERFRMIYDAVASAHPEITVIGTTGPFTAGYDFEEGWKFARELDLAMVDEHGYQSPGWFWQNLERYDAYDRAGCQVYLGEYAAHDAGRANTLRSALSEAAYLTSLERNGDLVRLSSYAPLLSKQRRTQWRPDMIYFDNVSITPSLNYYVQQLFSVNHGDQYLPTTVQVADKKEPCTTTAILLGTWNSQARFDDVRITAATNQTLTCSFDRDSDPWNEQSGQWHVADGTYCQASSAQPALSRFSFPQPNGDYTINLRAMKTGGEEGFLIGFAANDDDNYYWWNLGGWVNTCHAVERSVDGSRSIHGRTVDGAIDPNRWYDIRIELVDKRIRCYLDDNLIHDLPLNEGGGPSDLAASTVRDTATGDLIIKLVSKASEPIRATLDSSALGSLSNTATRTVLSGEPMAENKSGRPPEILPATDTIPVTSPLQLDLPPHSLTILRIPPEKQQ